MIPTRKPIPTRPSSPPPPPPPDSEVFSFADREVGVMPLRMMFYAVEGWGKTTLAAHAPSPIVLMARGETGWDVLRSAGRVPSAPGMVLETWRQLIGVLDSIIADTNGRKTLILDGMGSFERLCHEFVCARDFQNDWGEKGFLAYGRGPEVAISEWLQMIQRLDKAKAAGLTVILIAHARVKAFKNPTGSDFDQYQLDMNDKTTAVTSRWADEIGFGVFESVVVGNESNVTKKGKGIGGANRVMHFARRDAWIAKRKIVSENTVRFGDDHAASWDTLAATFIQGV